MSESIYSIFLDNSEIAAEQFPCSASTPWIAEKCREVISYKTGVIQSKIQFVKIIDRMIFFAKSDV